MADGRERASVKAGIARKGRNINRTDVAGSATKTFTRERARRGASFGCPARGAKKRPPAQLFFYGTAERHRVGKTKTKGNYGFKSNDLEPGEGTVIKNTPKGERRPDAVRRGKAIKAHRLEPTNKLELIESLLHPLTRREGSIALRRGASQNNVFRFHRTSEDRTTYATTSPTPTERQQLRPKGMTGVYHKEIVDRLSYLWGGNGRPGARG